MSDTKERLQRARSQFPPPEGVMESLRRRRDRKRRNQRIRAGVLGLAIAIAVGWLGVNAIRSTSPVPADDPTPPEGLGIFEPVAGRIVYENETNDHLWAVNPRWPSDTAEGPPVADDLASTLVPLDLATVQGFENVRVFGWSSDGTELLFARIEEYSAENPFPQGYLYVLHPDGSETRLNRDPMSFAEFPAAISPDGKHVAFATDGVYVVDAQGGRPVRIAEEGQAPTFSPDGTKVAYFIGRNDENQVWIANVDGSDAHEILAHDAISLGAPTGMQWSPAGDRLAIGVGASKGSDALAIYTFAPDGSDFTRVITGGISPYWSPDGSQIAYTILCSERNDASCPEGSILRSQFDAQPRLFGGGAAGLAIADADGSNVREFGFAASGPWHPGE